MIASLLLLLSLNGNGLETLENHAEQIKACVPALKGRYRDTWAITGWQMKAVLGEPSHAHITTLASGGTWHYCRCRYEKLGIGVVLYAENRLVWAVPGNQPVPDDWEVQSVFRLTTKAK